MKLLKNIWKYFKPIFSKELWNYIFSGKYIIKLELKHLLIPLGLILVITTIVSIIPALDSFLHFPKEEELTFFSKIWFLIDHHWFFELIGFIILFFYENIRHQIDIEKIENGKFRRELFKIIDSAIKSNEQENNMIDKLNALREKIHYLQYANQQIGESLVFEPDSESIDMLQETNGIISITEADPIKWQNPTYNFFLINNLLTSLTNKINKISSFESVNYANSENELFKDSFLNNKTVHLNNIKNLDSVDELLRFFEENPNTFRFYWLSEEEFNLNKNIIELLIAYHNLFGSYLFFINPEYFALYEENDKQSRLKTVMNYHNYDYSSNNSKIDLAFGINNDIHMVFNKNNALKKETLIEDEKLNLLHFLKQLATQILDKKDDQKCILYHTKFPDEFTYNSRYCHTYIKETTASE